MVEFPLENITVVEFANVLAAPLVGSFLGDFGANVIKVERPIYGDTSRVYGLKPGSRNLGFIITNRNKKSITLDLHFNEGQEIARRLCEKADVVLSNFRPGVLERWDLSPETLLKINPNLILCLISAYGQTGPYSKRGGFDRNISAFTNITYTSGFPDQPPVRSGFPLVDYMTGYLGAYSVMLALYNREVNGTGGEIIDLSLTETALKVNGSMFETFLRNKQIPGRYGNRIPFVVPAENFLTNDDKWIAINANSDKLWEKLAKAMEKPELLEDDRFSVRINRVRNQDELYEIIGKWVKNFTANEILNYLVEAEIPIEIVRNISDLVDDPHLNERKAIISMDDHEFGKVRLPGVTPKLKKFPGSVRSLGPALGSHNKEIYESLLGISGEKMEDLKKKGII
jgi:crotonobetainyl-CoA:carnitine CoA-transferase CaiB-like acyl-CoA transferase